MDRTYVSSSNIASIGYDPMQRILEVEFLNGSSTSITMCRKLFMRALCPRSRTGSTSTSTSRKGVTGLKGFKKCVLITNYHASR